MWLQADSGEICIRPYYTGWPHWQLLILIIVELSASVAIAKRQEKMLEELLRRSECRPITLELSNPVTRSQAAKLHLGSGN